MKITLVDPSSSDWQGLYIDGKLVMENHQLSIYEILDAIGIDYKYIEADDEWLANRGSLPEKLSQVKKTKNG